MRKLVEQAKKHEKKLKGRIGGGGSDVTHHSHLYILKGFSWPEFNLGFV